MCVVFGLALASDSRSPNGRAPIPVPTPHTLPSTRALVSPDFVLVKVVGSEIPGAESFVLPPSDVLFRAACLGEGSMDIAVYIDGKLDTRVTHLWCTGDATYWIPLAQTAGGNARVVVDGAVSTKWEVVFAMPPA